MKAQHKHNNTLIVEVLSYSGKLFTGRILESGLGAWKKGEVSNSFAIKNFNILTDMRDHLNIREQVKGIIKSHF